MRPEAGPGGPWLCGSAEVEGWLMGVPSLTSDLVRPRAQGMVRTCPRSLPALVRLMRSLLTGWPARL